MRTETCAHLIICSLGSRETVQNCTNKSWPCQSMQIQINHFLFTVTSEKPFLSWVGRNSHLSLRAFRTLPECQFDLYLQSHCTAPSLCRVSQFSYWKPLIHCPRPTTADEHREIRQERLADFDFHFAPSLSQVSGPVSAALTNTGFPFFSPLPSLGQTISVFLLCNKLRLCPPPPHTPSHPFFPFFLSFQESLLGTFLCRESSNVNRKHLALFATAL